jgi:hypothetical protein
MAQQPTQQPAVIDPDSVPETLCDGQFYIHGSGPFVTLTFTHLRPDAGPMFADDQLALRQIVRARIVMTVGNVVALRDLLSRVLENPDRSPAAAGGTAVH